MSTPTSTPRVVAIVQARMGSTRLPGKILLPLGSRSVLARVIERVRAVPSINAVVIATTTSASDDPVVAEALACGAKVSRGSELDVLDRYRIAAIEHGADVIVRITSDCPLIDPRTTGTVVARYLAAAQSDTPLDYVSNTIDRSDPRGFDTEVFSRNALESAWRDGHSPAEREHVTPFLYRHPERFRQAQVRSAVDRSHWRLTLDTAEDYELLRTLYERIDMDRGIVDGDTVISYLEAHPELLGINAHVEQKALGR